MKLLAGTLPALLIITGTLCAPTSAGASTIIVTSADTGWYTQDGRHDADNTNYLVGLCCGVGVHHNFFVFDLSTVTGAITAASLRLNTFVYLADATETVTYFDVSTPIASLVAGGTGLVTTYTDLGSGAQYGQRTYQLTDQDTIRDVVLNTTGVAAIQSALGGMFAVGGALTTLNAAPPVQEFVYGGSAGPVQLVLETATTVPEPAT